MRLKTIMQQSGASRRLSSCWAQPAGCLRGVLVKRGADEASVHFGTVRYVLGLHPSRQIPLSSRRPRSEAFGARVDPRRNPLPLLCSQTPNATLTLSGRGMSGQAGSDVTHHTPSEQSPIRTGQQINDNTSLTSRFSSISRYCCY